MTKLDGFTELILQRERTLFILHGWRQAGNGEVGSNYVKQAYSLSMALDDLNANAGVADDDNVATDAFIVLEEDGSPVVHVEVRSLLQLLRQEEVDF